MQSRVALGMVIAVLGGPTHAQTLKPLTVDFHSDLQQQFHLRAKQSNSVTQRFYLYQGTNAFDASGLTCLLKYAPDRTSSAMVSVSASAATNGYCEFALTSAKLAAPFADWYCVLIVNSNSTVEGLMTVLPAPEMTAGTLSFATALAWSGRTYTGTRTYGPYTSGSNVVFGAEDVNGRVPINANLDGYQTDPATATINHGGYGATNIADIGWVRAGSAFTPSVEYGLNCETGVVALVASGPDTFSPRVVLHGTGRAVYPGDIDIVAGPFSNALIKLWAPGNIELHGNKIVLNSTTHIAVLLATNSADVASGELWSSNGVVRVKP